MKTQKALNDPRMLKTLLAVTVLLAGLVTLAPSVATGQQGNRPGFVQRLDADGDGKVSADEFDGPAERFSHLDRDGDGYVSEEEAPKGPPQGGRQGRGGRGGGFRG